MPTIFRDGPYRFYFFSHEPNEPSHVHVDRDACSLKAWLEPVNFAPPSVATFDPAAAEKSAARYPATTIRL